MLFKTATLLATAVSSVSAIGSLGFNLDAHQFDGNCKDANAYSADLDHLSDYTSIVKTYAVSDCNTLQTLGPVAEEKGFQLSLGVWPNDDAHFAAEKSALQSYLPWISRDTVKYITVGSEALYRDDMSASELAEKISEIKDLVKGISDKDGNSYESVPVGTVDSWNVLVDAGNRDAIVASDVVFANAFSYWQGQAMNNASFSFVDDIMQAMQVIQTVKGSDNLDFWVGETGWPTGGENFGNAYPSTENLETFWKEGICGIRAWGINTFVFEAFDGPFKASGVEQHFGFFNADRSEKFSLTCDF